ncbi:MAG: head-tail connector protein, partial [Aestuariivirga sp.]
SHPPRLLLRGSRVWARPGRIGNGIEIAVTVGFGATPGDVPAELRQAVLDLVAHWYANRGDESETALPLTIAVVIERFREKRL